MLYLNYDLIEKQLILNGEKEKAWESYTSRKNELIENKKIRKEINNYSFLNSCNSGIIGGVSIESMSASYANNPKFRLNKVNAKSNLNHNSTRVRLERKLTRKLKQMERGLF